MLILDYWFLEGLNPKGSTHMHPLMTSTITLLMLSLGVMRLIPFYMKRANPIPKVVILLALVGALLSACTGSQAEPEALPPLRIGANAWVGYGAVHIAAAKGFFDEEGVEVEVIPYENYDLSAADLASKRLDGNMTALSDVIAQSAAGISQQVIYVLDYSDGGDVVVSNGEFTNVADLQGKRIGLSYGTFSHVFVLSGLANVGLTADDVTIVSMTESVVPGALADGTIDAGHTWEPFLSEALDNGGQIIFTSADTPGVIADLVTIRTDIIEQRPDDIEAMVRAIVRGTTFWSENPDEGNTIVADAVGEEASLVSIIVAEELNILSLENNLLAFDSSTEGALSLWESGQFAIDVFLENEIIDEAPDLTTIINSSFVEAAASN